MLNNAIKYTDEGTVTLTVKQESRQEEQMRLFFSVRDTGSGIRKQDLEALFDAFTQVDLKKNKGKEGTGLGLAISRQLVELMGGELSVTSEYGKGSEFYFTLSQGIKSSDDLGNFTQVKERPEEKEEDVFTFTAPDAKILLVDDNEINREVGKALLEPFEMQISMTGNGQEALEMVQAEQYDLVFMDHYMPVMDGVEATKQIRMLEQEGGKKLPIIALTADALKDTREEFFAVGMNDFISKPIAMDEMTRVLQQWLPKEKICKKAK